MELKEEKVSGFTLPDELVTVKFIKRKKGLAANVDDSHVISGGMLQGARKRYCAPLNKNGTVANILTKEEKAYLEDITNGINLSVYGDFWKTYTVSLFKDSASNTFNTSNPMDFIAVKLLETYSEEIAPSWKERNKKSTYQFVITRSNEEFKEKKATLDTKKRAFKVYGKIEDDRDKLIGILKLLSNQPISADSKLDWIQGKVEEYVDKLPSSFLDIVEDSAFDIKVLINKGVEKGLIIRSGNKYKTIDGLELCENGEIPSFDNAVRYLSEPKNQEVLSLLEARVDTL